MVLRKINAGVSLLTTILLLIHAIFLSIYMLSGNSTARPAELMSWALVGTVVIHAFISVDLAFSGYLESDNHKGKKYAKMNIPTIVQRVSGILMLPAAGLHIAGAIGAMVPPKMVHAIVPPLFFAIVLAHTAISTSKALISLGIGNTKLIKTVDMVMRVICGATLIAGVIGIYLRTFVGVAA